VNRSFQLIRTNPRLTTNIKLVIDSSYNLYFESFDSSKELSNQQYKHYLLNRESVIENEIPNFYKTLPKNLAFTPKTQIDSDIMYNEYIQQFDSTYFAGANEIEDQWYKEEFEYLAPLYFKKNEQPSKFIILRVDEPAIYELDGDNYIISELNKNNFRSEIIDKWKCVSVFDLSNNTNIGKFFDRNFNNNDRFPEFSFFFDIKKYNYSKWSGLEYKTGVYTTSELFLDDKLYYSNPHFNLEEFITKGFENNGLLYPHILNIKFLFDDSPATPDEFLKWSMNRYYGFYAEDLELVKCITSAELPNLKSGLTIKNNVFLSGSTSVNPYIIGYTSNKWIQVENSFYEVKVQSNGSYKIISDTNLTDYDVSTFNKGTCSITNKNGIPYLSGIGMTTNIDEYLDVDGTDTDLYADIYLIEINNIYHILKKDNDGNHYIQTDYMILSDSQTLQYYKGGKNNEFSGQTSIIGTNGKPLYYSIYRVKLSDIKDFDFDRIHTHYSDFDYEKSEYVDTMEEKLYAKEYRDNSIPRKYKTHDKGEDGQYKVKNIASEYSAEDETFELRGGVITPIFEKNQSICKWGYDGSISHSDYPYKLNNNISCGGSYNRTTNTSLKVSNIKEKTLDYFYRIGDLYGKNQDDVVTGFTSNYGSDWTIVNADNQWVTDHLWLNNMTTSVPAYLTLNSSYPIIINELYNIEITANNVQGSVSWYNFGVDPNSFANATTTEINNINISFVGRALSSGLTLFISGATMIDIYTIKVTQIVNKYYLNQSTNIQTNLLRKYDPYYTNINGFNLKLYVDSQFDYFDFFFKNIMYYENFGKVYEKPFVKYSIFNGGDDDLPASTLFKGIEYKLYSVQDMVLNPPSSSIETIRNIITQGGSKFNEYKFAVILSDNYNLYNLDKTKVGDTYTYTYNSSVGDKNISIYDPDNRLIKSSYNGIHIFLNDKFKNIIVIINKNIPINNEWGTLNNVDIFGENYGLYFGKTLDGYNLLPISGTTPTRYNSDTLSASYFIDSLNNLNTKNVYDNYVSYYYIDENSNFASTEMIKFTNDTGLSGFTTISNWNNKFPLFYLETITSDIIKTKKNSYITTPLKGPETNIYDKYLIYSSGIPLNKSYIDEPLSRQIDKYEVDETKNNVVHGEVIYNTDTINRYVGYYEPIFKNLSIFKPTYYWQSGNTYNSIVGNYIFGDDLGQFATIEEMMYSKVNELNNYLKLKNSDTERSYFPMVDEIGLSQTSRFIFLSSWDRNFYIKTLNEQTFLQEYVAIPQQIISIPPAAELISSTVSGFETAPSYTSGMKIYGSIKKPSPTYSLNYTVSVKNLASESKTISLRMYYKSTWTTTTKIELGFITVGSNTIGSLSTTQPRPTELKTGQSSYEEYTRWDIYFECYDYTDGTILDTKTFLNFNVYNDLINFTLTSPNVEGTPTGVHTTGQQYWFNVILNETNQKIPSIPYTSTLSLKLSGSTNYWLAKTLSQSMDAVVSNSETILFSAITLDRINLNWAYGLTDITTVLYYIEHVYEIEGVNNKITYTDSSIQNYNITGEINPPNIEWYSTIPTISKTCGSCVDSAYSGDRFTVSNVVVINNGGDFSGSITYNYTLMQNGTDMAVTKVVTENGLNILAGATYQAELLPLLGPLYDNSVKPLISYLNKDYSARVHIVGILDSKTTATIVGCNVTAPDCDTTLDDGTGGTGGSGGTGGTTCLDENTLITLSNGQKKALKYLIIGEKVLSYKINNNITESINWIGDINEGAFDTSIVKSIEKNYVKGYYVINDYLKATPFHPLLVRDNTGLWRWLLIKNVKIGYKLFKEDGSIMTVNSNVYLDAYIEIVKVDVEETDNYFAGGILNHNKSTGLYLE
jgi:hypothetical protein